jgi:MoxR-like ATPase
MRQPVFIWGEPGVGKSSIVHQLAQDLYSSHYPEWEWNEDKGRWCKRATKKQRAEEGAAVKYPDGYTKTQRNPPWLRDLRGALLDAVDVRGLPAVNGNGKAHWLPPDFLPENDGRPGMVFLDELNRATTMVQNSLFQLLTPPYMIGEYEFPIENWAIVAAGNYAGPGVQKMDPAMSNRFVHIDSEPHMDDWCRWAAGADIEPAVMAFVRFNPNLLHKFEKDKREFPTPRTWEFVSRIVTGKPSKAVEQALFSGAVGHGAAIEFIAFLNLFRELPSIDAILLNPKTAMIPEANKPSVAYAVAMALARVATEDNIGRALLYLNRLPVEYNVLAVKAMTKRDAGLQTTPEFTAWCTKHSGVTF